MLNPRESLLYAAEKYPERLEMIPLEQIVVDSARSNARRPAFVKLAVTDEMVKALRGPSDKSKNLLLLVSIPKDVLERSESKIILPNEI